MRRILSKEEEAKRARRNQFIIGGVMILIMFASILGYSLSREETTNTEKVIYNEFEFTKQSGFWNLNKENYQFSFKYNPKETEKINPALNLLGSYANKPLYIYSENMEATTEIYRNLFYQNRIVERVQDACINGSRCDNNYPIKNCESNFIIIKESNNTEIKQQQNCVFISGNMGNLTELSDSFLFKLIGVQ